ncbi:MAG: S8 family serine peptidase [Ruminococcus sp.]|nr:S8 family serine peptidase [Ruminococcus sp.]
MKKLIIIIASAVAVAVGIGTFSFLHKGSDKPDKKVEDIGEIYCAPIDEDHIASSGDGVYYADNEILIVAKPDVTKKDIKELAANYNAEVVGCIEKTGDYQLRLDNDDPQKLVDLITKETIIESASLNYITKMAADVADDIQIGKEWTSEPITYRTNNPFLWDINIKSWGVNAINTYEAWIKMNLFKDKINPVNVGLIDSGFFMHDDLGFAEVFYENGNNRVDENDEKHGTHVAGIMAAKGNNKEGICGVYPYADGKLYGASWSGAQQYNKDRISVMKEKCCLSELIIRNVKVINCSYGCMEHSALYNTQDYQQDKKSCAKLLGDFLNRLYRNGYDFVIVVSAGNGSDEVVTKLETTKNKQGEDIIKLKDGKAFYDENGYPMVVDRDLFGNLTISEEINGKTVKHPIMGITDIDRQTFIAKDDLQDKHLDSEYVSAYTAISPKEYKDIYDRIIVVGAIDRKFNICDFSNAGERVDIFAPGEKIYSTIHKNRYDYDSGTSMAAPHVAGVCANVWSIDNTLSGEEIKNIVCSSWLNDKNVYTTPSGHNKGIVDCRKAVEKAFDGANKKDSTIVKSVNNGAVLGWVYETDEKTPIEGAKITAQNGEQTYTAISDKYGHFELIVPGGEYTIVVGESEYNEWKSKQPVKVNNGEVCYYNDGEGETIRLEKKNSESTQTADSLKKNIEEMSGGKIALWAEADYDGDGKTEAFAVVSKGGEIRDKSKIYNLDSIYFVNSKGEISRAKKFNGLDCYYDDSYQNSIDGLKFFSISLHPGTWSTTGYVFGVDADKFFEPSVSGKYSGFDFTKEGKAYAVERKIKDEGGGHIQTNHEMTFDKASKEFIILSDRGTDTKQAILPEGVVEFSGHYYMVFSNPDKYDAYKSEQACVEMGGHLVSINSQSEQDFIVGVLGSKDNYWIGLEKKNNSWHWIDGSDFSYTHWDVWKDSKGKEFWQPDNLENREYNARIAGKSVTYEDWYMNKGGWIDTDGSGKGEDLSTYGFICEWTDHPDAEKIKKYS